MSTKRRSRDTHKGKSVKKSKEGEVAVINPDLEDDVIRNEFKEAWKKKTSFSQGSCAAHVQLTDSLTDTAVCNKPVVSEVLTDEKCRLSLSGWFHGPSLERPLRYTEPAATRLTHVLADEEKYKQVIEALRLAEIQWEGRGPPNKRLHALAAGDEESDDEAQEGQSEAQEGQSEAQEGQSEAQEGQSSTEYLEDERNDHDGQSSSPTSLSAKKSPKGPPVCVGELRRWSHGDYTLLHDSVKREFALDLLLHLGCPGWKVEFGGFTSYIADDEDQEVGDEVQRFRFKM
ncbi:Prolyl 3-hydroxylase OGFOD1 [Bagarius yarrelli]|uniref:Prolyl 3-hydroxylase OGFOD1 n=1 Tax=Bagarius yarrelli TaxID=175774 RepID=A0A556VCN6_BAGYA|nr:Prolyl 3-hydroxylase OGFOD1 [Bagarius yarrelli]